MGYKSIMRTDESVSEGRCISFHFIRSLKSQNKPEIREKLRMGSLEIVNFSEHSATSQPSNPSIRSHVHVNFKISKFCWSEGRQGGGGLVACMHPPCFEDSYILATYCFEVLY